MYVANPQPSIGRVLLERDINTLLPWMRNKARWLRPGRKSDQDDLVQETLARALFYCDSFTACHSGAAEDQLRAWLLPMMQNIQTSIGRKLAKETAMPDNFGQDQFAGPASPENLLARALTIYTATQPAAEHCVYMHEIALRFKELSAQQQTALRLVALEGYTVDEASKVMGIAVCTASSAVRKARTKLIEDARPRFHADNASPEFMAEIYLDEAAWAQFSHIFPADVKGRTFRHVSDRVVLSLVRQMLRENINYLRAAGDVCGSETIIKRLRHWHRLGFLPEIYKIMQRQPGAEQFHWNALPAPYRPVH